PAEAGAGANRPSGARLHRGYGRTVAGRHRCHLGEFPDCRRSPIKDGARPMVSANKHVTDRGGPVERLIAFSARNWLLTLMVVAAGAVWGWRSLMGAPLDAIPDLSDVQVIVFTEWPGQSPDL